MLKSNEYKCIGIREQAFNDPSIAHMTRENAIIEDVAKAKFGVSVPTNGAPNSDCQRVLFMSYTLTDLYITSRFLGRLEFLYGILLVDVK